MAKNFVFITDCVNARGEDIRNMVDHDRCHQITRRTFLQRVDYQAVMADIETALGYGPWLHMASDWAVSYWKSFYRGVPCVYFNWSAIEYVFVAEKDARKARR